MLKPKPMPKATVTIRCDECRKKIGEVELLTDRLAAVLFHIRKEHAIAVHGWSPEES